MPVCTCVCMHTHIATYTFMHVSISAHTHSHTTYVAMYTYSMLLLYHSLLYITTCKLEVNTCIIVPTAYTRTSACMLYLKTACNNKYTLAS